MMSRWLGTMNSPHMSMPTAYGNAMATPNCSRPGSNITTPAMSFAVQMNGSKNFVSKTARTKAVASGSGYPVAMMVGSAT